MNPNAQPADLAIPQKYLPDGVGREQQQELLDILWMKLLFGGDPDFDHLVDYICDYPFFSEDGTGRELPAISQADAEELAEFLINTRIAQQATFAGGGEGGEVSAPGVPCFRNPLSSAFEEIRRHGIVAAENFTCCNTCGHEEIYTQVPREGDWRAYVFFHQQDVENIFEYGEGGLSFGALQDISDKELTELISEVVLPILHKHNIHAEWNNSLDSRIQLRDITLYYPLKWKS